MPLVMNVFDPFRTYSSPSRIAVVAMPARSEPVPGSVIATAVIEFAGGDAGQPTLGLLVVAVLDEVRRADVVVQRQPEPGAADAGGRQLLGEHDVEAEVVGAAAAPLLRDGHPEEPVAAGGARTPRAA